MQGNKRAGPTKGGRGGRSRARGGNRGGRGRTSSSVIDLTPQPTNATGPGPFGLMGAMGMRPTAMSTMSLMSMMGMPCGGKTNSQFGFGFGGVRVGGNTKDTVTVKLSLEGAARAQCMEHSAQLGPGRSRW